MTIFRHGGRLTPKWQFQIESDLGDGNALADEVKTECDQ